MGNGWKERKGGKLIIDFGLEAIREGICMGIVGRGFGGRKNGDR